MFKVFYGKIATFILLVSRIGLIFERSAVARPRMGASGAIPSVILSSVSELRQLLEVMVLYSEHKEKA